MIRYGTARLSSECVDFRPVRVLEIELTERLPSITNGPSEAGLTYGSAAILFRLHGQPLDTVIVQLSEEVLSPAGLAAVLSDHLTSTVNEHLQREALPAVHSLDELSSPEYQLPCSAWNTPNGIDTVSLSVVVPTYRRPHELARCLDSVLANTSSPLEVIVVDNDPADGRSALMLQERFAGVASIRYLPEPTMGAARARNRGFRAAKGDVVALVDDDVTVDAHWVAIMRRTFAGDPTLDCVTGLILAQELETPAQLWCEQYGGFNKGYSSQLFDLVEHTRPGLYPYQVGIYGSGSNMALRRSSFASSDVFDVRLGPGTPTCGAEDLDVFLDVVLGGGLLRYEPSAIVWHPHHRDYAAFKRTMRGYGRGLGALVAKRLLVNGAHRRQLLRRLPAGVAFALNPRSAKNSRKRPGYPAAATWYELLGLVEGPVAYACSRASSRRPTGRSDTLGTVGVAARAVR